MIVSYGEEEYLDNKKRLVRYPFFQDPIDGGKDAIFGLDIPLMRLVHVLRAAAPGLRPREAHHPAARPGRLAKSTIARLLKKGIEHYSRTPRARSTPTSG
jgi:serine protein kinase